MPDTLTPPAVARGKVIAATDEKITFAPANTNYELHLVPAVGGRKFTEPLVMPTNIIIRVAARKVYTVPSGGNFVAPIFGPPRIVQGRVRSIDAPAGRMVIHAGTTFHVTLPKADTAIDLDEGQITVGHQVNVACLPGSTYEPA